MSRDVRSPLDAVNAAGQDPCDDSARISAMTNAESEDTYLGDSLKAKEKLGWEPKVRFKELVELMVDADVAALEDQLAGKVTRYSHEGI
jgi:GDPmannose 4,6-dehydratase